MNEQIENIIIGQGATIAQPKKAGFNCIKTRHFRKEVFKIFFCQKRFLVFIEVFPPQFKNAPGLYTRCNKSNHWATQKCRSKFLKSGKGAPKQGNEQNGVP